MSVNFESLFTKWKIAGHSNINHIAAYVFVKESIEPDVLRGLCKNMPGFFRSIFNRAVEAVKVSRKPRIKDRRPLLTEKEDKLFLETLK
jgi:hypothetical protein